MDAQPTIAWSDLQLLLAIASDRSMLAAARRLGLDASTLSRRMTGLEAAVAHKLLLRGPGGVQLTPVATALVERARGFDQEVDRLLRDGATAAASGPGLRGRIRVTAGAGFGDWIVPIADTLLRAHPRLSIDLAIEERVADLARFEADLGLRVVHGREGSLVYEPLGELAFGVFATDDYLRRAPPIVRTADLTRHRVVGQLTNTRLSPQDSALRAAAAVEWSLRTSFLGQVAAVRRGLGVAALPALVAQGLVRVLPRLALPPMPLFLAWHRESRDRPEVRALATAIRTQARRDLHG